MSQSQRGTDVIVALSFGAGKDGSRPGKSNEVIARLVADFNPAGDLSMILQKEVAAALPASLKDLPIVISENKLHPGQYLDTYEALRQAREVMAKEGWRRAFLFCHPAHAPRASRVFRKLGVEPIIYKHMLAGIPFDPQSVQSWTRDWLRWWLREIPAMLLYKLRGWI